MQRFHNLGCQTGNKLHESTAAINKRLFAGQFPGTKATV